VGVATSFETQAGRNRRRTYVLLASLFVLVSSSALATGLFLGYGSSIRLVLAVALSVLAVWGSYWHSDRIVLTMTRARLVEYAAAPQLHNVVSEVCLAAGLPVPRIAIVDDAAPNAFATGRDPQHAVVAFTTGLLELMDREELQGVAAHELAHVANRDTLVMSVAATTAGIVALIADLTWRVAFYGSRSSRGKRDSSPLLLLAALVTLVLAPLAAGLLRAAVSRSRERLADAAAVSFTRNPAGLRRALEKLESDSTVVSARSNALAHLWIESPLDRRSGRARLFDTHPPISERILALRAMEA
jgi:heat shock protein HtpX